MAERRKYEHVEQISHDGWSDWVLPVQTGYRLACCDCHLVHEMDFRVIDGKAQFRMRRDRRATANARRHR